MIMNKDIYYVYLHIKETNGEPFYVGKGKGKRDIDKNNRNKWWNNIVNKHNFDIIRLGENLTEQEAFELEIYWIKRIGRKTLNKGPLVNLNDGGSGSWQHINENNKGENNSFYGKKHTEETKKIMSEKITEWNKHNDNAFKGKKHKKESLEKLSKSLTGKFKDGKNPASKKVMNIETGQIFETMNLACEYQKITRPTMRSWCKKEYKYKWI